MSIEDFVTEEAEASGLNIRVTAHLDVDGYAKEVADEVDDQLFHAVAIRKGYVPERTCEIIVRGTWLYCSFCRACVNGGYSDATSHYPMRHCPSCGAKVVGE